MKILLLFSNLLIGICSAFGQNYVGLSQSKIIRNFGDPDERGEDFFSYFDDDENGMNTYYFDDKKICKAFVIARNITYLKEYQKMLNDDFAKITENQYIYTSKHRNFKAEISRTREYFELRITPLDKEIAYYIREKELAKQD